MEGIYQHYVIDMSSNNNFVQVPTMQGDGNGVRGFEIELTQNNVPYVIDTNTTLVYIVGSKPDTKHILNDCVVDENGYVVVDITTQMSAINGVGHYSVMLVDKEGNNKIDSFPFMIITTASPYDVSYIESSDEYRALAKTLGDVSVITQEAIEKIENIDSLQIVWQSQEDARVAAENIRVDSENKRISSENTREANEVLRDNAEIIREQNEKERVENEETRTANEEYRVSREDYRESNEKKRYLAELSRVQSEKDRISAESTRVDDETTRQINESTRIANENKRNSQESARQTNSANMLSNMQTALTDTLTATDSCNTATTRANDIAQDLELKRDTNYYKGEKGDPGVVYTLDAQFAFQIEDGRLILYYQDGEEAPNFSINSEGHLIYEIPET